MNYSQNFPGKMSFVCNCVYFIFHLTPCHKYAGKKNLGSPSAEQISLSIAFLLRKRLIIMFQSDAAHCEICSAAISKKKKNAFHRKTSAWLTANSENNCLDTIILACEKEMDGKDLVLMHT